MKPLAIAVLLTLVTSTLRAGELEKWTDVTGRYTIEAEFMGTADGDVALLVGKDGNEIRVPFGRLGRESLLRLCRYLNIREPATDTPDAPPESETEKTQPVSTDAQEASVEEINAAIDKPTRRPNRTRRRSLPPLDVRTVSQEIAQIRDAGGRRRGWKLSQLRELSDRLSMDSGRKVQSFAVIEELTQEESQIRCRLRPPVFGASVFPLSAKIDRNSIHPGDVAQIDGYVRLDPKRIVFDGRWWADDNGLGLVFEELVITNVRQR
jgi:hypothetical protein